MAAPAKTVTPYGVIAEFETPADIMHAAEKVRDAGFRRWDVLHRIRFTGWTMQWG
jgi:hypothetical protein